MRPIFFEIGPFPIYAYGFMILLGFITAMYVAAARFRAKGINPEHVYDIGLIAMVFGILGARIFYLAQYRYEFSWALFDYTKDLGFLDIAAGFIAGLMVFVACYHNARHCYYLAIAGVVIIVGRYHGFIKTEPGSFHLADAAFVLFTGYLDWRNTTAAWGYFKNQRVRILTIFGLLLSGLIAIRAFHCYRFASEYSSSWAIFMIWKGGLVFYGGFLMATGALVYFLKRKNLPVLQVCDVLAPCVALALALTRIGCFCNGCCYGRFCPPDHPLGIHYPPDSLVGQRNLDGIDLETLYRFHAPKDVYERWFDTPLFRLRLEHLEDLNKGALSERLKNQFAQEKYPLAPDAHLGYGIENRKWLVKGKGKTQYYILPAFHQIFTSTLSARQPLNKGAIPEDLREEFIRHGRSLSSNATAAVEKADRRWLIEDKPYRYLIIRENASKLLVYENSLNVYTPLEWRDLAPYVPAEIRRTIFHPVYPSQLASSLVGFLLFLLLSIFYRYRRNDGEVLLLFAIVYGVARFLLEFLRNDSPPILGTGLTAGQATSVVLFGCCLPIFIVLRLRAIHRTFRCQGTCRKETL